MSWRPNRLRAASNEPVPPGRHTLLRRGWPFLAPLRVHLAALVGLTAASAAATACVPLALRAVVNGLIDPSRRGVVGPALAYGAVLSGGALLGFASTLLGRWLGTRLVADVRTALFQHLQDVPLEFYRHSHRGALVSRVLVDPEEMSRLVTMVIPGLISNTVILVAAVVIVAFLAPWGLAALAVVPALYGVSRRVSATARRLTRATLARSASLSGFLAERTSPNAVINIRNWGGQHEDIDRFTDRARAVQETEYGTIRANVQLALAFGLFGAAAATVLYALGGMAVRDGSMDAGTVIAIGSYIWQIQQPVVALGGVHIATASATAAFESVLDVLESPVGDTGERELPPAPAAGWQPKVLELRRVSFGFSAPRGEPSAAAGDALLDGITLSVRRGERVAIVGPTGVGKSTLALILTGHEAPTSGAVLLDGQPLDGWPPDIVGRHVALVTQQPFLLHDTLAANLRVAKPGATDEEVVECCRAAQVHDAIRSLPAGYATVVGEEGVRLSGGERQRVALARALLRDAAFIVLDEASAHLDGATDTLVQASMLAALDDRGVIIIAHRPRAVVQAHRIIVLHEGKVVDQGTFEELAGRAGWFDRAFGAR